MAGPYADDSGALLVFGVAELDELQQLGPRRSAGSTLVSGRPRGAGVSRLGVC